MSSSATRCATPAPMPNSSRPPQTASTVAAILASIAGGRNRLLVTNRPARSRSVCAARAERRVLPALVQMASDGRLHAPVARQFDVSEAQAAYQEFSSGPHRGRIVLTF
jgi:NADPH:quinone reductase-like Zn-dependent oxidoreductase